MSVEIELVPTTGWFSNVRSNVLPRTWDRIQREVAQRHGWRCAQCQRAGSHHPVECHEIWTYDDDLLVQRLAGLVSLCPDCHLVKHFGFALAQGRTRQALAWLCHLNSWTAAQAMEHVQTAMQVQAARSRHQWRLDLSLLTRSFAVRLDARQQEL